MGIGIFILLYTEPLAFVRIQRTMQMHSLRGYKQFWIGKTDKIYTIIYWWFGNITFS